MQTGKSSFSTFIKIGGRADRLKVTLVLLYAFIMIGGREDMILRADWILRGDRILRADRIGKFVWRGDGKFTMVTLLLWFGEGTGNSLK